MVSAPRRIGVVGASGYVGQALVAALAGDEHVDLALFGRRGGRVHGVPMRSLGTDAGDFVGLDCVVHLAAMTSGRATEAEYRAANVDFAVATARRALSAGVKRFVFVSSIVVHGRRRQHPVSPDSTLAPVDAYGRSKASAEAALTALAEQSGLEVIVLRPPMVYGPGSGGNFARLIRLIDTGLPLPFAKARSPRTFCSIANLISALRFAIDSPSPPRVLLPGDQADSSTAGLARTIAEARSRRLRLWGPEARLVARMLTAAGFSPLADSLFGPLVVDRAHWEAAGWGPPEPGAEAMRQAAMTGAPDSTILYLTNSTPYFLSHRLALAKEARGRGFDVLLAGSDTGSHLERLRQEGIRPVCVPHIVRGLNPVADLRAGLGIGRVIRRLRPQIVHCTGLKTIFLCALAGRFVPLPRIVCLVPGLGSLYGDDRLTARLTRLVVETMLRPLMQRHETLTVFQNRDDQAYFLGRGIVRDQGARLIRGSGVDTDEFTQRHEPATSPPLVVFPARLLRSKGVLEFIEAARRLRARRVEARFALVGDLDPAGRGSLTQAELDAVREAGEVEVWGFRSDMREVFAESHLVCLPSLYREGVPRCLIEAASVGRAIVTTDIPGCREIVVDGLNGLLVPTRDPQALADALETLIRDPSARARMGEASRRRVEDGFSSLIVNRTMADLYESALSRELSD
jgi:nucleoside-diphosphate-sugar epimerase/glycosyltransferase involved in cell wall biosynthesis